MEAGPSSSQPQPLFGEASVATPRGDSVRQHSGRFRFVKRGGGRGPKAGTFKLKQYGISFPGGVDLPCQEVYMPRLFCYMYRGPPASPGLETCHLCENRMCLAPWHLVWGTHRENTKGYFVHKRNRHHYHPYGRGVQPVGASP